LGHHNAIYTDAQSGEGENLRNLTANIIKYLAEHSAFLMVEPKQKLPSIWGRIKGKDKFYE